MNDNIGSGASAPALGLDVGSVSISMVLVDSERRIVRSYYAPHHGLIRRAVGRALERVAPASDCLVCATASTPAYVRAARRIDNRVALIAAALELHPDVRSLLYAGGESFGLIRFNEDGSYRDVRSSSSCAAGTGSFLDQQALRLGMPDASELALRALEHSGPVPAIASRCAVFAKSDIIHAQSEGYTLPEICAGLCLGLARNLHDGVVRGERLAEPAVIAGGVARNRAVTTRLGELCGVAISADESAPLYGALGAALQRSAGDTDVVGRSRPGTGGRSPGDTDVVGRSRPGTGGRSPGDTVLTVKQLLADEEPRVSPRYEMIHLQSRLDQSAPPGEHFLIDLPQVAPGIPVEVDRYAPCSALETSELYLGIDIGSTSTKAVFVNRAKRVLVGLYTRTAGQPLRAIRALFGAFELTAKGCALRIGGVATTGAGRKFAGAVVGADLVVDEISAHARAAFELEPRVDTIIEIGGQDAKFTLVRDGLVTFSQMNTVCAAGTGSFLEEQASKLGLTIEAYGGLQDGVRAPLTSDRCTVFMERDLSRCLNLGFESNELLAAAVIGVRENYLLKVATEGSIGKRVCFQGATAKNRALVAAFEERLGRPIFVSPYCHLTGALGAALGLLDAGVGSTRFRGLDVWREELPLEIEECALCTNRCRIRVTSVGGERVAFGFACGREYDTRRFVPKKGGLDLLALRRAAVAPIISADDERARSSGARSAGTPLRVPRTDAGPDAASGRVRIGLADALMMSEELPFWRAVLTRLGAEVVASGPRGDPIAEGKRIAGAEFCAPMAAFHAHVSELADRVAWIFLPIWIGPSAFRTPRARSASRACYYTQFGASLAAGVVDGRARIIAPVIRSSDSAAQTQRELLRVLRPALGKQVTLRTLARALAEAERLSGRLRTALERLFVERFDAASGVSVLLIGRPYTILAPTMNKGIPEIIASFGVSAFYQDMVPKRFRARSADTAARGRGAEREACTAPTSPDSDDGAGGSGAEHPFTHEIARLTRAFHWHYAGEIIEAAERCAETPALYPVLVTSFKCSPDSFAIEYFKRILDANHKPYLVLQLDEHDSTVGYETRIEAGLRSFRNHRRAELDRASSNGRRARMLPIVPHVERRVGDRTLLFPNWDPITCRFLAANLRRAGIDARPLDENDAIIRTAMRRNTGQCIPLNIIVEDFVTYIRSRGLSPERCALWMARAGVACNIPLFPYYIKSLLQSYGEGMERAAVYLGELSHAEISPQAAVRAYFAYLAGGMLRRLGCRTRPYELAPGVSDRTIAECTELLEQAFEGARPLAETMTLAAERFDRIERRIAARPKVAIFGDFYVRDNETMNGDLIRSVENAGGEVVTTPYNEYVKIISRGYFESWRRQGKILTLLENRALLSAIELVERRFAGLLAGYPMPSSAECSEGTIENLAKFDVNVTQEGESYDNILKIFHILRTNPDVSLFVQASPSFCCPSLVTEAMARRIERVTGVPFVTITYDGTAVRTTDLIVPYLAFPRRTRGAST